MKSYRASRGPFREQPYYEAREIENTCTDELRAVGLYPKEPSPIRIDRFIEKRFGVTPQYDTLPDGVLGISRFGPKGLQEVIVARFLSEEESKSAERRINSTLAHEAGHGLFHAHLFVLEGGSEPLFGERSDEGLTKVLCREVREGETASSRRYDGQWWEFQANQAIGALLMPRQLVEIALESFVEVRGALGSRVLPQGQREEAIRHVGNIFDVNQVVARIRIEGIFPPNPEQLAL